MKGQREQHVIGRPPFIQLCLQSCYASIITVSRMFDIMLSLLLRGNSLIRIFVYAIIMKLPSKSQTLMLIVSLRFIHFQLILTNDTCIIADTITRIHCVVYAYVNSEKFLCQQQASAYDYNYIIGS